MCIGKLACSIAKSMKSCEVLNTPDIAHCGVIGLNEMSSIILDKMDEYDDNKANIYLPDMNVKIYRKKDVVDFLKLTEVDHISFVDERRDCDDMAATLFGMFAGLVWTDRHALNWFVDDTLKFWFIEPQTDKLSQTLEGWQGSWFRFFIGR